MDSKWLAKVVERLDPWDQSPDFGRVTIRKSRSDAGKFDVLGVAPFRIPLYRYQISSRKLSVTCTNFLVGCSASAKLCSLASFQPLDGGLQCLESLIVVALGREDPP
jgi:hypothetical protein